MMVYACTSMTSIASINVNSVYIYTYYLVYEFRMQATDTIHLYMSIFKYLGLTHMTHFYLKINLIFALFKYYPTYSIL